MIRKSNLPAIVAALALAGAPIAFATTAFGATTPPASTQGTAAPAGNGPGGAPSSPTKPTAATPSTPKIHYITFSDRVSRRDVAAFGSSKLSLDQAIAAAEGKLHGKAVEASFRGTGSRPHYVVRVMDRGRVFTAAVDSASGQVTRVGHGVSVHRLYPGERAEFLRTAEARTNLANAVAFAQKAAKANPIAASLAGNHGTRGYEVFVVDNNALQTVWVSPDNWPTLAMK